MAEDKSMEVAKERLAAERKAREAREAKSREAYDASESKPTPTQEENDLAKLGAHVVEKEPDGSPEQGSDEPETKTSTTTKQSEARKPAGGYQTRTATPAAPYRSSET